MMKRIRTTAVSLFTLLALTLAPAAWAQESTRSIKLFRPATLGEQQLARGDYSVKFVEDKDGEIVFLKGDREMAKTTYKIAQLAAPAAETSVIYALAADGSYRIKRIEFKGKTAAVSFE